MTQPSAHAAASHFDRRGATYDQDDVHHRVASLLAVGADIRPGFQVLDIATGTGLLALQAARQVGPAGTVVGIDVSAGVLAEAERKAQAAGLQNLRFMLADAGRLDLPRASFDCVFCSSGLVLMPDIPQALRHWFGFVKPGGTMAFDAPAKPFGISQTIAESAAAHGVHLPYADVADTPGKCRSLLETAGFEVMAVRTELTHTDPIELSHAIAFYESRLDHPAWHALSQAEPETREAIRSDYVRRLTSAAVAGYVLNDTALNLSFGRRPM